MNARLRGTMSACAAALLFASAAGASTPTTGAASGTQAARRLEDIHIEGEIPVPQVLFVTGRDQRRFLDFQHRRYANASFGGGRTTTAPSWIRVVDQGGKR